MYLVITFLRENLQGRILNNLPHVHKSHPRFNHCIREIDENSGMYYLKNDEGEIVAQCHYEINDDQLCFTLFEGELKKDLQNMFTFYLTSELAEKAYVKTEEMYLFYNLENFFLKEESGYYKIGTDYESIIPVELYHVPLEIR